MPGYDEEMSVSATAEVEKPEKKTLLDYFALAISTCGVGYIPLAPGTWGSVVGVGIYLIVTRLEAGVYSRYGSDVGTAAHLTAWIHAFNLTLFLLYCLLSVWASNRATILFRTKDPQKVVVDEVIGQLTAFLFVPFLVSWQLILAGFLLFRLFDIWKPYPINALENLPAGIGVCADDILAGVYAGICLTFIYAISLSF